MTAKRRACPLNRYACIASELAISRYNLLAKGKGEKDEEGYLLVLKDLFRRRSEKRGPEPFEINLSVPRDSFGHAIMRGFGRTRRDKSRQFLPGVDLFDTQPWHKGYTTRLDWVDSRSRMTRVGGLYE